MSLGGVHRCVGGPLGTQGLAGSAPALPLGEKLISLAESGPDKVPGSSLQTAPSSIATTSATTLTMPTSVLQVCINVVRCISLVIEAGASA